VTAAAMADTEQQQQQPPQQPPLRTLRAAALFLKLSSREHPFGVL